jgi:hypothetical protein
MNKTLRTPASRGAAAALLVATLVLAAPVSQGEEYSFLVSGYPAANVSYQSASAPTALAPGAIVATLDASGADMRSGTSGASEGIALRSDKALAFTIVVR